MREKISNSSRNGSMGDREKLSFLTDKQRAERLEQTIKGLETENFYEIQREFLNILGVMDTDGIVDLHRGGRLFDGSILGSICSIINGTGYAKEMIVAKAFEGFLDRARTYDLRKMNDSEEDKAFRYNTQFNGIWQVRSLPKPNITQNTDLIGCDELAHSSEDNENLVYYFSKEDFSNEEQERVYKKTNDLIKILCAGFKIYPKISEDEIKKREIEGNLSEEEKILSSQDFDEVRRQGIEERYLLSRTPIRGENPFRPQIHSLANIALNIFPERSNEFLDLVRFTGKLKKYDPTEETHFGRWMPNYPIETTEIQRYYPVQTRVPNGIYDKFVEKEVIFYAGLNRQIEIFSASIVGLEKSIK